MSLIVLTASFCNSSSPPGTVIVWEMRDSTSLP